MDEALLKRAVRRAATDLSRAGVDARAAGTALQCRYGRSGQVRLENRLHMVAEFDHELFLNRFATALVKGTGNRP